MGHFSPPHVENWQPFLKEGLQPAPMPLEACPGTALYPIGGSPCIDRVHRGFLNKANDSSLGQNMGQEGGTLNPFIPYTTVLIPTRNWAHNRELS